jgi:RecA-family ATPase
VRSFVNLWRAIAHQSRAAVLLLDHPSLSGMTNGTGRGGNMDWRNSVRSALYLHNPEDKAEADRGVRILETVKSNYGPLGSPTRLEWKDGGLAVEGTPDAMQRATRDQEAEHTFLRLLDERERLGLSVYPAPGRNYAPSMFADMEGNGGYSKQVFARAMHRLMVAGTLKTTPVGPPSKGKAKLVRAPAEEVEP